MIRMMKKYSIKVRATIEFAVIRNDETASELASLKVISYHK
jgi:hypothetical protein